MSVSAIANTSAAAMSSRVVIAAPGAGVAARSAAATRVEILVMTGGSE
jgi:hypothetical protein